MITKDLERCIKHLNKSSKEIEDALKKEDIGLVFSALRYAIQLSYLIWQHYVETDDSCEEHDFYLTKYTRLVKAKSNIEIPLFEGLAVFREIIKEKL